jgi:hypothetical protein
MLAIIFHSRGKVVFPKKKSDDLFIFPNLNHFATVSGVGYHRVGINYGLPLGKIMLDHCSWKTTIL